MLLLTRYVCRYFVRFFWGGLGACAALLLLIEIFDRLDEFIERQVLWQDAVWYLALKLPEMLYQMVPAACLLASVFTFSTLSKYQEITAIRAAGLSPLRLARPLFLCGGVACLGLLVAQEYLLPYTNQAYNLIWRTRISHQKIDMRLGLFQQGQIWYRSPQRLWSVKLSAPLEQRLLGVTIYELDAAGVIRQRYDAAEARWDAQEGWTLLQGTHRTFDASGMFAGLPEVFAERRLPFPEQLLEISTVRKQPENMSLREILASARQARSEGLHDPLYLVEFHGRVAFAAVCIIMAGFGVPLALRSNRSGGAVRAVGLTLLGGFSYWIVHSIAMAFGHNGQLPPLVAAWSANFCFGAGSVYLSARL
jgi:lipopolysaccharide export system permease protein